MSAQLPQKTETGNEPEASTITTNLCITNTTVHIVPKQIAYRNHGLIVVIHLLQPDLEFLGIPK